MRGLRVIALAWITLSPSAAYAQSDAAVQRGNDIYQYWCATCHGRGPGNPGTTALAAKYKGALPGILEDRTDLTPQAVRFAVRRGTSIMPFFRKTEVSDADLDAIAQYLTRRPARAGEAKETNALRFDRDAMFGWGKRGYNWEFGAGVQREILPRVSVDGGYFRRWYGNFRVTDNIALGPADFSAYTVMAPTAQGFRAVARR